MSWKNRFIMVTLLGMTVSVLLPACTDNKEKPLSDPVEIHFLTTFPERFKSDPLAQPIQNAAVAFNRLNPASKVIIDYMPDGMFSWESYLKKLEDDSAPDIIQWYPSMTRMASDKGLLMDLLPLAGKGLDIPQNILDFAAVDGKLFVLPHGAHPAVITFNKSMFDKADIPYPEGKWTWEQFREVSKKTKALYGSVLTFDLNTLDLLMASKGRRVLSPDGTTALGYLDSTEAVSTVRWLNDYYLDDPDKEAPMPGSSFFGAFDGGSTAMIVGTLGNQYSQFQGENRKKLGIAPLPYFEGGKRANPIFFSGLAIPSKSKHPALAWKFIEYIALSANEDARTLAQEYIPTSPTVFDSMKTDSDPSRSVYNEELKYAVPTLDTLNPDIAKALTAEFNAQFETLFRAGDEDIPGKLHQLALKLDQELQRAKLGR